MHAMVLSHLSYCVTVLESGFSTDYEPVRSLYKQTLNILYKKPIRWHHCNILQKHSLNLSLIKMFFKCVNNLVQDIICQLISKQRSKGITIRGATNQNCAVPKKKL